MRHPIHSLLIVLTLATIVCESCSLLASSTRLAAQAPAEGKAPKKLALKGFDPVALTAGREVPGDKAIALDHNGFRYLFATAANRKQFEQEPSRFKIQLEGKCGVMPGVPGDPALFAVVKDRIYIFGTPECRTKFVSEPAKFLKVRRNVAIFVYQGVEVLDFTGPAEAFATADEGRAFRVYTVAATPGEIVSQGFLTIKPQYALANCPKPDLIVLPGGPNGSVPIEDDRVIKWLQKVSPDTEVVMSVCTGAFLLAKAGLLDGKEATTHWGAIEGLKKAAPNTKVRIDQRFVDNGRIVTTAGVSASIDGALHVIERMLGDKVAQDTARYMEYRWEPSPSRN